MSPQAQQPKVLFVLTSHDQMGNSGKPTGWYLPEFAHPYDILAPHAQITIASVLGGASPLDPASIDAAKDDISVNFLKTQESLWKNTAPLADFVGKAAEFDAVFYVGGHGPMFDLAHNTKSHQIISEFHSQNRIIAAVCHGPAALAYAKLPSGKYFLEDTAVTGFSNTEEQNYGVLDAMPFELETALNEASNGKFEKAKDDYAPNVVVAREGKIITGQNPASASGVGEAILAQLRKQGKSV
ncbi:putative chaperone protein HSP31 [Sclerotinia borealis F-4128]|uniref:D-lactate dehydratase n=1 Tax=Sclerotinia borealis (strain F-4128) TaxID=1432307 RepID=W9C980_SCLBF|nr:putative chaperone protein HSP31 [Sclerotinia borealis F-4128]